MKSFTVAGNFYQLLKNITALANNTQLPTPFGMTTFGESAPAEQLFEEFGFTVDNVVAKAKALL